MCTRVCLRMCACGRAWTCVRVHVRVHVCASVCRSRVQAMTHHREVTAKRNIVAKVVDCVCFILVGFIASTIVGVGSTLDGGVQVSVCLSVHAGVGVESCRRTLSA